jgi:hypothetical protein
LGGIWNNAAFVDFMKIGSILNRFFFSMKKAAVFEAVTERQTG